MENPVPHFEPVVIEKFERFPDQEACYITSVDPSAQFSEEDYATIVAICNEELVFKLFSRIPGFENGYTLEHAKGFIEKAQSNWDSHNAYVFLIRNAKGKIVACTDIKSSNLDDAEVGYWASAEYPGVMANAVKALCTVAREAGFRNLYALIRPENEKSARVAMHAGMHFTKQVEKNETVYNRFDITL